MKNYIAEGKTITLKITDSNLRLKSSEPYLIGSIFGIAANDASANIDHGANPYGTVANDSVELYVQGIWELRKDNSVFRAGDKVYFDPVPKSDLEGVPAVTRVTAAPAEADKDGDKKAKKSDLILIGIASQDASKEDAKVRVRLNGVSL